MVNYVKINDWSKDIKRSMQQQKQTTTNIRSTP
jgi:hypothetical protein